MTYTLYDLRITLAPYADGGLSPNDTGGPAGTNRVVARLNESVDRLMSKMNPDNTIQCVRMCAHNGCITCGRDIEKIVKARIDGTFANVFDKWYEYLEGGPGMVGDDASNYVDLIDRGMVPVQYDIPEPMRVMVISDEAEAVDSTILIRGFDETNREVRTEANGTWFYGESVPITRDTGFFTQNDFSVITSIIKPVTNGYVYLSAVTADDWSDPGTFTREHLAGYHPSETRPSYRRYAFKTNAYSEVEDKDYRLNALVKMKFFPMSHDTDTCPITSLPAIKAMLQAMHYQDSGEFDKGTAYEQIAGQLLMEDAENHDTAEVIPDVQLSGYGANEIVPV